MGLSGSRRRSERFSEQKNLQDLQGFDSRIVEPAVRSLYGLRYLGCLCYRKYIVEAHLPPPPLLISLVSVLSVYCYHYCILPHVSFDFRFLKNGKSYAVWHTPSFVGCVVPDVSTCISDSIFRVSQSKKNRFISWIVLTTKKMNYEPVEITDASPH